MGHQTLNSWVAWVMFMAAFALAPGVSSQVTASASKTQDIERAVVLGKAGRIADALDLLHPWLDVNDPSSAKAWFVSGFLHKEAFKAERQTKSRQEAIEHLKMALTLEEDLPNLSDWHESARRALSYLGGTFFDEALLSVRAFEPGDEVDVFGALEAHVEVATFLDPSVDASEERAEFHKHVARAYNQWFMSTGDGDHFERLEENYEAALALKPADVTASYNLAVNLYNRGVGLIKQVDVNTSLPDLMDIQETSRAFFEKSLPWFERARQSQPNRPEILRGLMVVHHALYEDDLSEQFRLQLEEVLRQ